jgi:hypothetical protein
MSAEINSCSLPWAPQTGFGKDLHSAPDVQFLDPEGALTPESGPLCVASHSTCGKRFGTNRKGCEIPEPHTSRARHGQSAGGLRPGQVPTSWHSRPLGSLARQAAFVLTGEGHCHGTLSPEQSFSNHHLSALPRRATFGRQRSLHFGKPNQQASPANVPQVTERHRRDASRDVLSRFFRI